MGKPTFGPAGNSDSFSEMGYKKSSQAPEWVSAAGLDSYEYQAGHGITGSDDSRIIIGEKARQYGIKMSIHAPYYISLSSLEPDKQANSVGYIERTAKAAKALGASLMVVHMGAAGKIDRTQAMSYTAVAVIRALERLSELGLDDIAIGLETMGKINQLGTLEEVIEICKLDSRLRPVVDFGHLYTRSLGTDYKSQDDFSKIFDSIGEGLTSEIAENLHCHFSKIEYTGAGERRHLNFSDVTFGPAFEPLMEVICKMGLSPNIICESAGKQAEDALAMKKYYFSLPQV